MIQVNTTTHRLGASTEHEESKTSAVANLRRKYLCKVGSRRVLSRSVKLKFLKAFQIIKLPHREYNPLNYEGSLREAHSAVLEPYTSLINLQSGSSPEKTDCTCKLANLATIHTITTKRTCNLQSDNLPTVARANHDASYKRRRGR